MADSIHKTKGIVLRAVPYGETSLIVAIYTELFGLQSYMVNGIRTASKKTGNKLVFFRPATLLELEAYHHPFKRLNRIREYRLAYPQDEIQTHILKNGVALYMIELLIQCIKEPETNPDLFAFVEDCLQHLNACPREVTANFPIFFALHLSYFLGFSAVDHLGKHPDGESMFFEPGGTISSVGVPKPDFHLEPQAAGVLTELMRARQPAELAGIQTHAGIRRKILESLEQYYQLHLPGFGRLKTLRVLTEIW